MTEMAYIGAFQVALTHGNMTCKCFQSKFTTHSQFCRKPYHAIYCSIIWSLFYTIHKQQFHIQDANIFYLLQTDLIFGLNVSKVS